MFDLGDIVRVSLEPVVGREIQGDFRPVLVLTKRNFNKIGDVLVAPITHGGNMSRYAGFAVSLTGAGCQTQGVILLNKIRMLDLKARGAKRIEKVPEYIMEEVSGRLIALLEGE